jgi:hypothetical protein
VLAGLTGAEQDRAGRVTVQPDLTLPGHPEVFALGDMIRVRSSDGSAIAFPGLAPVAMQQGRYAARAVRARLEGRVAPPFRYRDKGNLATIGRAARSVADVKGRQGQRLPRLGDLAGRPPLLSHRLPEPALRPHPLVHRLSRRAAADPADHDPGDVEARETSRRPRWRRADGGSEDRGLDAFGCRFRLSHVR